MVKPVEAVRHGFELAIHDINRFLEKYEAVIKKYEIVSSGIWNIDKCGTRIGVVGGRIKVVIVKATRAKMAEAYNFKNIELVTIIGCGNSVGEFIPLYNIFK